MGQNCIYLVYKLFCGSCVVHKVKVLYLVGIGMVVFSEFF